MNESKISVRYAKALFLLAQEKDQLDAVRNDILLIRKVMNENELFSQFLGSPVVRASRKIELTGKIFSDKISQLTIKFLHLLIQNKRENYLNAIFRRFLDVYSTHNGIKSATITTVVPLDEALQKTLMELIATSFKTKVELTVQEDTSLIGGFILRVGDQQYDASIATGLKRVKNSLLTENNN